LPGFEREEISNKPVDTMFGKKINRLMTQEEHELKNYNQGYLNRHNLRYYDEDDFEMNYYEDLYQERVELSKRCEEYNRIDRERVPSGEWVEHPYPGAGAMWISYDDDVNPQIYVPEK
jgi:hypothetical protein